MGYIMKSCDIDSDNMIFYRVDHKKRGLHSKKKAKRITKAIKQSRRINRKHK